MKLVLAAVLAATLLAIAPVTLYVLSNETQIEIDPAVKALGAETPVHVHLENSHGVRQVTAIVEQDGKRYAVAGSHAPAPRLFFLRREERPKDQTIVLGKKTVPALHDGKARVIIEAQSNDLRARTDQVSFDVNVILTPPRVVADGAQHYLNTGGSELVTFTPSGNFSESGVKSGRYTFRSFPLPTDPSRERFSLFAYPWDLPDNVTPLVYASNPSGATATATFWFKLFPKRFRSRDIAIDDKFLDKVVNQIDPNGAGDLLQRFLRINRELRQKNNKTLADLRLQSEPNFYWSGPFLQLGNSQVESVFADRRSYIYKGKKVDEQVHLGFDLAVTAHVPIPASNDGKIVWASDLGIYGNCVVVDHGYGLQSIYGHLSQIDVKKGDMVKKGQTLGRSGSTGLAGGDHLHFSMQVDGVQVNPVEWWDAHWIHDRILSKIKPAGTT